MLIVIASQHLAVFRPVDEGNGGAVDADETLAIVMNERQEVGFLLRVHFKIAAGKEKHGIEVIKILGVVLQLLFGQGLGVGAERGVPQAGLPSQALDRGHGMGHRLVPVSFFFSNHQQVLLLRAGRLGQAKRAQHGGYQKSAKDDLHLILWSQALVAKLICSRLEPYRLACFSSGCKSLGGMSAS